uniref:E4 protein n=1 Tax=Human papillomavirus TaxID=10566 RepID=A0A3G8G7G7_9PAPI|nr:E4 protein [Human papillomavirus]
MLPGLAKLDTGKYMLTRTLSLLLLLALRRQLETGQTGQPPSTPHPGRRQFGVSLPPPCPAENGHHHGDTEEKHLALQPPPPGKKDKEKKPQQDDQGPPQGGNKQPPGEGTDADGDENAPTPETPPVPPTGEGEGEVEGGPKPDPNQGPSHDPGRGRDPEGLLPGVALRLTKWENQFEQLVEIIVDDLKDYWMKLGIPQ